jgi:hypothetical protein
MLQEFKVSVSEEYAESIQMFTKKTTTLGQKVLKGI